MWLLVRTFSIKKWSVLNTILAVLLGIFLFVWIGSIVIIYFLRPKEITYGGYGISLPLTGPQIEQNINLPLNMGAIYGMYEDFLLTPNGNYSISTLYTHEAYGGHYKLRNINTGRIVYLLPANNIGPEIMSREQSITDIEAVFGDIKPELDSSDNWSICLPLGKATDGYFTQIARAITGSTVGGHATAIFIENNGGRITIHHLDPKAYDGHASAINEYLMRMGMYFTRTIIDSDGEEIDLNVNVHKRSCGVQPMVNNVHCVYYVFKMIYYYLQGNAVWDDMDLGRHICPEALDSKVEASGALGFVRSAGSSLFGYFSGRKAQGSDQRTHLGTNLYQGGRYLDSNDVRVIGAYARPSGSGRPLLQTEELSETVQSVSDFDD